MPRRFYASARGRAYELHAKNAANGVIYCRFGSGQAQPFALRKVAWFDHTVAKGA